MLAKTVREKARDIAVLVAMGARRVQIGSVFVLQGLIAGVWGAAGGSIAGYAAAFAADHWQLVPLNPEVYGIAYMPFSPSLLDTFLIVLGALAICLVATLYPAWLAVHLSPTEMLRYE